MRVTVDERQFSAVLTSDGVNDVHTSNPSSRVMPFLIPHKTSETSIRPPGQGISNVCKSYNHTLRPKHLGPIMCPCTEDEE